jgi:hypothetical protein
MHLSVVLFATIAMVVAVIHGQPSQNAEQVCAFQHVANIMIVTFIIKTDVSVEM